MLLYTCVYTYTCYIYVHKRTCSFPLNKPISNRELALEKQLIAYSSLLDNPKYVRR